MLSIIPHLSSWLILFAIISTFERAFFAWAIQFIDVSVAVILYDASPVFMILLMSKLYQGDGRFGEISPWFMLLVVVAFVGFAMVTASETGSLVNLQYGGAGIFLTGLLLLLLGVTCNVMTVFGFRWGTNLSRDKKFLVEVQGTAQSLEMGCIVLAFLMSSSVSVGVSAVIGRASLEPFDLQVLGTAVLGGFVVGIGSLTWRKANLITTNLGANALAYAIPIFSLGWLALFSQVQLARLDYLIIGAAAIITANLLINFEAEVRSGFKALLLALGICGAVVYLRDGVFELLGVVKWNWTGSGYFESITLAATVFTLLLAFRVARLVSRTSEEDNRTFIVYRKLDLLARRGIIDPQVCDYILQIDKANNDVSTEREAYTKARRLIADVDPRPLNEADSQLLSDAEANLDALARSKQVDIHLGEQFALGIFGVITIGLALLTLPPQVEEGWPRLMVDLFAMLISAVIIFLLFHIQDLQRERDDQKLDQSETLPEYRHYLVRFLDIQRRSFDKRLSITVGAAIVVIYTGLLANKWLGWLGWLG